MADGWMQESVYALDVVVIMKKMIPLITLGHIVAVYAADGLLTVPLIPHHVQKARRLVSTPDPERPQAGHRHLAEDAKQLSVIYQGYGVSNGADLTMHLCCSHDRDSRHTMWIYGLERLLKDRL